MYLASHPRQEAMLPHNSLQLWNRILFYAVLERKNISTFDAFPFHNYYHVYFYLSILFLLLMLLCFLLLFLSILHRLGSSGKKEHQFRKDLHLIGMKASLWGVFYWLMIDMGWPKPLLSVPPLGRWSWTAQERQLILSLERRAVDSIPSRFRFSSCL